MEAETEYDSAREISHIRVSQLASNADDESCVGAPLEIAVEICNCLVALEED